MPERIKENKSKGIGLKAEKVGGGAEIFIPKKRTHKIRYPKNYDA